MRSLSVSPRVIARRFGLCAFVLTPVKASHIDGKAENPTFTKMHESTTVRKAELYLFLLDTLILTLGTSFLYIYKLLCAADCSTELKSCMMRPKRKVPYKAQVACAVMANY
jgi:hypothetical protein